MTIQAGGIISGLDTQNIIDQMMELEQRPIDIVTARQEDFTVKLTTFGLLESKLKTLNTALANLDNDRDFNVFSTSSTDSETVTASASVSASPGSFEISVTQLATAHKLKSAAFTPDVAVGAGTLHIKDSATATAIDITVDADDTLADIADAINKSEAKVTAKVISDGTNEYLSLTADATGEANTISITVDDADAGNTDNSNLSRLAYEGATANLTQVQGAQDAIFTVDGITDIKRAANTVTDVITGVTLTLTKAHADPLTESETVTVSRNTSSISEKLTTFVTAYNDLLEFFSTYQKKYDAEEETAGVLVGDSTTNMIKNTLRRNLNSLVSGVASFDSLSDLGIALNQSDSPRLEINSETLNDALNNHYEDVQKFFSQTTEGKEGFAVKLVDSLKSMLKSDDGILTAKKEGFTESIARLQTRIDTMTDKLETTEASLWSRFNSLELLLAQYDTTGDYLTSQITSMQNLNSSISG